MRETPKTLKKKISFHKKKAKAYQSKLDDIENPTIGFNYKNKNK